MCGDRGLCESCSLKVGCRVAAQIIAYIQRPQPDGAAGVRFSKVAAIIPDHIPFDVVESEIIHKQVLAKILGVEFGLSGDLKDLRPGGI
jgi:hypothetical protein